MSRSLKTWQVQQLSRLDELETAHAAVGGTKPGRRYTTTQINHALVVAIAAQFQAYCRNLHSEAVGVIVAEIADAGLQGVVQGGMTSNRRLDQANANFDNIAADFERVGVDIWGRARKRNRTTSKRIKRLRELMDWRNAIAHQDFNKLGGRTEARLGEARGWRSTCNGLVQTFDLVVADYLEDLTGTRPWK
jgi:hypothetical protein